ncbi:MAG: hypothetical protein Q9178_000097 [Gyalolechia marmorata]
MSTEREHYTKVAVDSKGILLTNPKPSQKLSPKTVTVRFEVDHSFTIPIPKNSGKAKGYPRYDDIGIQAIEKEFRDQGEGPYNPVVILLTAQCPFLPDAYSVIAISALVIWIPSVDSFSVWILRAGPAPFALLYPAMRHSFCCPLTDLTSTLLVYIFYFSTLPCLARAEAADTIIHEDHNHHRLLNPYDQTDTLQHGQIRERSYEPDWAGLDRGIIGRAPEDVTALANNAPQPMNIEPGEIQYWTFPKSSLQGPHANHAFNLPLNPNATRDTTCLEDDPITTCLEDDLIELAENQNTAANSPHVWLSISVCDQPTSATAGAAGAPPQLEVYVSQSSNNQKPDRGRSEHNVDVEGGYGYLNLSSVSEDIWVGVRAPQLPGFDGIYNYELAASIDAPYVTYFNGDPNLNDTPITAWDTDSNSSILWTGDITKSLSNTTTFSQWMEMNPPFSVYIHDEEDRAFQSMIRSVCGLRNHAKVKKSDNSMIKIGGQPKQLFYVNGLNRSTTYYAIMTLEFGSANATAGGGGTVWKATRFKTKSDNNCQIIHNLPFCTDVAYAVPANPVKVPNTTELGLLYDTYANNTYQNFSKSLQQIPCETNDSTTKYSLVRDCQDCDNAYKAWLCAVSIPRCEDFSTPDNTLKALIPRSIGAKQFVNGSVVPNATSGHLLSPENKTKNYYAFSRNPMIDDRIQPGPYKELLPFCVSVGGEGVEL